MASSKFSSPFFKKSPLLGAYSSGADAVFAPSDAQHFSKLSSDILGGTLAAMNPKSSKCEELKTRRNNGTISQKAYEAASEDCIDTGGLTEGYGGAQTQAGYDYFNS